LPEGYYQAALFFTGNNCPTGAAITFAGEDSGGSDAPTSIATQIKDLWATTIDAQTNSEVTLASIRVKKGPMEDGPFATVTVANAGGLAGAPSAPQCALLVRKNSAIGGKSGSGRMYVPGIRESTVLSSGLLEPTELGALQTAWTAFYNGLVTNLTPMALAHNYGEYVNSKGETVVVPPRVPTPVTSLTCDARVATQRRRNRR
jgi:hypothetical protein